MDGCTIWAIYLYRASYSWKTYKKEDLRPVAIILVHKIINSLVCKVQPEPYFIQTPLRKHQSAVQPTSAFISTHLPEQITLTIYYSVNLLYMELITK